MRTILLSQRVDVVESYQERRDCLDQRWCGFVEACGYRPVPVMNTLEDMEGFVKDMSPAAIILTGGNDLVRYGGNAPERDEAEKRLLICGLSRHIPVIGVCRGMQFITDHFGGELCRVSGHVARRHMLAGEIIREVNSYHGFAAAGPPDGFDVLARAEDGVIEAMVCREKRVLAIMWHPEREAPYKPADVGLFTSFISQGGV